MSGGITIQKKYYNQEYVINKIHKETGCSIRDIKNILSTLRNVVKDKFSDLDEYVEIKLFPGLKVTSRYIPFEQSNLKPCNSNKIKSNYSLYLNGEFGDRFKDEIKEKHDCLQNIQ